MVWKLKYGEELENIEAMKASFQKIPKHLLNPIEPPQYLMLLERMFWELDSERNYDFTTGICQKIPVTKIEERLKIYGFEGIEAEELKDIIRSMDRTFQDYRVSEYNKKNPKK